MALLLRRNHVESLSPAPGPDWDPETGGVRMLRFTDPDGHSLVLVQFPHPGPGPDDGGARRIKYSSALPGREGDMALHRFGFIVTGAGYEPDRHIASIDSAQMTTTIVGVSSPEQALPIAQPMVADGVVGRADAPPRHHIQA